MALPSNNNGVISSYGNLLNLLLYLWNVFSPFPLTNVNTILDYLSYLRFGILWLRHFVLLGSWTVTYKLLLRGDNIPPPLSFTLTRLSSYLRCKGKCNENIQVEPAIHGQREICLNYKTKAVSSGSVSQHEPPGVCCLCVLLYCLERTGSQSRKILPNFASEAV